MLLHPGACGHLLLWTGTGATTTGTFLSNRMRNAMALCVSHNRLDAMGRQFKLFGDFGNAHTKVEVIDNVATGIRVSRSTGAPLCTSCLTSTSGQSDRSILSPSVIVALRLPSFHVLAQCGSYSTINHGEDHPQTSRFRRNETGESSLPTLSKVGTWSVDVPRLREPLPPRYPFRRDEADSSCLLHLTTDNIRFTVYADD